MRPRWRRRVAVVVDAMRCFWWWCGVHPWRIDQCAEVASFGGVVSLVMWSTVMRETGLLAEAERVLGADVCGCGVAGRVEAYSGAMLNTDDLRHRLCWSVSLRVGARGLMGQAGSG